MYPVVEIAAPRYRVSTLTKIIKLMFKNLNEFLLFSLTFLNYAIVVKNQYKNIF